MDAIRYVFTTKKPELKGLVVKYGLSPAKNDHDLWKKTNFLVAKFREDFMKDLADIHPDKDLFAWRFSLDDKSHQTAPTPSVLDTIASNTKVEKTSGCSGEKTSGCGGEQKSNCCGSGADGHTDCNGCSGMKSNATGEEIKAKVKDNMPLVIIGSLALVFGVIALTNK